MTREKNEEFYDKEIAPKLAEIALKLKELDMNFVAVVYNQGDNYRTKLLNYDEARQRMINYTIESNGNVDKLIGVLVKDGEEYGNNSIYLNILNSK